MSIIGSNILAGASGQAGYNLNNSLRFRGSATAYLSRTAGTSTSSQKGTVSLWVKRGTLSTTYTQYLFQSSYNAPPYRDNHIGFTSTNTLEILFSYQTSIGGGWSDQIYLNTTQVFRDPSAWYHLVCNWDTTQATASDRASIYVNGQKVTSFGTATYPTLNQTLNVDTSGYTDFIGYSNGGGVFLQVSNFDGYIAEYNRIDGQALTPSSFGETSLTTGSWIPKRYTSTYGTNGFYLKFADTSAATAAAIGKDSSGNGNNWTPSGISVTAGTTYDAMLDVPTNTSATVGNYAVLNPLDTGSNITLSAANLQTSQGASAGISKGTIGISSGKWYWEVTLLSGTTAVGIADITSSRTQNYVGQTSTSYGYYSGTGSKYNNATGVAYGATYTTNDVIGVALDMDAGTLTFYKNNTSQGTAYSSLSGTFTPAIGNDQSNTTAFNAGQRPFTYTAPSGYVALNTYNLPTPTILQGNKYMDATTYTGTGATATITNAASFKPDFVWTKARSAAIGHLLYDSVRGATKYLQSASTSTEGTGTDSLTSFNTNGFSVGADTSTTGVNQSGTTYVGWQWQAGQGSTSSNTSGTITSTVSVNTTAGFSVVTYTGTGANATVGHGLGVAPKMIIAKGRGNVDNWPVYQASANASPATGHLLLNTTAAFTSTSTTWNNTAPTSTVFTIGTDTRINQNTITYVAYCWAEIAGFSKFTSYTGNNSADGPFVYCGFRPKFVMIKDTNTAGAWIILDSNRATYNVAAPFLQPSTSAAEVTIYNQLDFLSNGIKLRANNADSGQNNVNGNTYIVMAYAENPFKNSNAR